MVLLMMLDSMAERVGRVRFHSVRAEAQFTIARQRMMAQFDVELDGRLDEIAAEVGAKRAVRQGDAVQEQQVAQVAGVAYQPIAVTRHPEP